MATFVIAAALASIGITALLAVGLGRMNVSPEDRKKRDEGGGDGGAPVYADSSRRDADHSSDHGGSDGGGGDGGGD